MSTQPIKNYYSHNRNTSESPGSSLQNPRERSPEARRLKTQLQMMGATLDQRDKENVQLKERVVTLNTQVQLLQQKSICHIEAIVMMQETEITRTDAECNQWTKKYISAVKQGQAKVQQAKRDADTLQQRLVNEYEQIIRRQSAEVARSEDDRQAISKARAELKQTQELAKQLLRREEESEMRIQDLDTLIKDLESKLVLSNQHNSELRQLIDSKDEQIEQAKQQPNNEEELEDYQTKLRSIYKHNETLQLRLLEHDELLERFQTLESEYKKVVTDTQVPQAKLQLLYEKVDSLETENQHLESKVNKKRSKLRSLRTDYQTMSRDMHLTKEHIEKISDALERKRHKCKGHKQRCYESGKEKQDLIAKLNVKREKKRYLKIQIKDLTNKIQDMESNLGSTLTQCEQLKCTFQQLPIESLQQSQHVTTQLDEKLFKSENDKLTLIDKLDKKKLKNKSLKRQLKELTDTSGNFGTITFQKDKQLSHLEEIIQQQNQKIKAYKSKFEEFRSRVPKLLNSIQSLHQERWKTLAIIVDNRREILEFVQSQLEAQSLPQDKTQHQACKEKRQALKDEMAKQELLIEEYRKQALSLEGSIEEASDQIQQLTFKIQKKIAKVKSLKEKLSLTETLQQDYARLQEKHQDKKTKHKHLKQQLKEVELQLQTYTNNQGQVDDSSIENQKLENKSKKYRAAKSSIKSLQEQVANLVEEKQELESKLSNKKQSCKDIKSSKQELDAQYDELYSEHEDLKAIALQRKNKINELKEEILDLQQQASVDYERLRLDNDRLTELQAIQASEITALKGDIKSTHLYYEQELQGQSLVLADLKSQLESEFQQHENDKHLLQTNNENLQIEKMDHKRLEVADHTQEDQKVVFELRQQIEDYERSDAANKSELNELKSKFQQVYDELKLSKKKEKEADQIRKNLARKFAINKFVLVERTVELNLKSAYQKLQEQTLKDRTDLCKNLAARLQEKLIELSAQYFQDMDERYQVETERLNATIEQLKWSNAMTKTRMSVVMPTQMQAGSLNESFQSMQTEIKELKQKVEFKQQQNDRLIETHLATESRLQSLAHSRMPSMRSIDVEEDKRKQISDLVQENILLRSQIEQERAAVLAKEALQNYELYFDRIALESKDSAYTKLLFQYEESMKQSNKEMHDVLREKAELVTEHNLSLKDQQKQVASLNSRIEKQKAEISELSETIDRLNRDVSKYRNRAQSLEEITSQVTGLVNQAQTNARQREMANMAYEDLRERLVAGGQPRYSYNPLPNEQTKTPLIKSQSTKTYGDLKSDLPPQRQSFMSVLKQFGKKSSTESAGKEKEFQQLEKDYQLLMADHRQVQRDNESLTYSTQTLRSIIENMEGSEDLTALQNQLKDQQERASKQQELIMKLNAIRLIMLHYHRSKVRSLSQG